DAEYVPTNWGDAPRLPARVGASDLAALPVVLYEAGANTRRLIDQWAARAGIWLKPVMELGNVEAIKELVGAGLGCALVPRMGLGRAPARRGIVIRPLGPKLFRKLAIVLRRDKPLHRGLREVVGAIKAQAEPRGGESAFRSCGIGTRSGFVVWRIFLSANQCPPRIQSRAGLRGNRR